MHPHMMPQHNWWLIVIAVVVCIVGLTLSRLMFGRALRARDKSAHALRHRYQLGSALTAAVSVWSTHFLAMHAHGMGVVVAYDVGLTVGSLAIAVVLMFLRVQVAMMACSLWHRLVGVGLFVAAVAALHFIGIAALRVPAEILQDSTWIALSIAAALVFAVAAMRVGGVNDLMRVLVSAVLGSLSVASLHFGSMGGMIVVPNAAIQIPGDAMSSDAMLAWVVGAELLLVAAAFAGMSLAWLSKNNALIQVREAIDAMPDGMGFYDADDRLVVWNARYAEVNPEVASSLSAGLTFREILNIGMKEGLYAEAEGREAEWIEQRMAMRQGLSGTMEQHVAGDRWLRVQDRRTAAGGIVTVCSDITDLKRDAQALAEARDAAEAANRAKSEFLANMSHEIRTPLNGVIGLAQALDRTDLSDVQREMLNLIQSSGHTLQTLLGDILDLARVESGRLALQSEPFDLARAIQDAARLYAEPASAKGLQFYVDIEPDCAIWVEGDSVRLKQVLTNLVSNAVKFTAQGFVSLTVSRGRRVDKTPILRFTIEDTGVGFDAVSKARLFDRFEQADSTITRRFGGSGLGLSICRQLAGMMDGDLDCESEPGGGSSFILTLPLREVVMPQTSTSSPHHIHDAKGDGTPLLRVLLADDHPTNRKVVELILAQVPVELTITEDGAQAVEAWRQTTFDVILMDMQMPVMDGLTATREIRLHEAAMGVSYTPIIMLTANALPDHVAAGKAAGADRHLAKPFNAVELIELIGELAEEKTALAA